MGAQEFDSKEFYEAVMNLLLQMESELQRERLSLSLCDAWMEVEHIALEVEDEFV